MEKDKKHSCEEQEEEVVLPGFRFHPTDEELVGFYLRRKIEKKRITMEIIKQIDIYKYDPWDLPKVSNFGGEKEWYFFCLRGRKYRNSIRPNRVTDSGFWKATGIDRPIYSSSNNGECIGLKKSLVYYRGSAGKGTKTDWMMHEFRLPSNPDEHDNALPPSMQEAEVWTICRIFKRNITHKKYQQELKESIISKKDSQAQEQSSTLTNNSFESDARDSLLPSSNPNYGISMQPKLHQSHPFQGSSSAWNYQNYSAMNEFFKDGNWDELGRIMGYFGDSSAFVDATNPN